MPDFEDRAPREIQTTGAEKKPEPLVLDHEHILNDAMRRPLAERPLPSHMSNAALADELMTEGVPPALDRKDVPGTLARAAAIMNNRDLGIPSDRNMSSGTAISRLLQYAGAGIEQNGLIANVKQKLEAKGWESQPYTSKEQLKPGDLLFTDTDNRQGRNVGVVGIDGMIYSHNFRSGTLQGRTDWSSKFITVMRQTH